MVFAVVNDGLTLAAAARAFNTTPKTVGKWVARFRKDGAAALCDRSSRPLSSPRQTSAASCDAVEALRRERRTQAAIAAELGLAPATVSRILKRRGLSRLSAIEPAPPRPRYERATPGEIIAKLGIRHIRTRPYTPQTNGKAERFIQTALREWAYATAFETSEQRRQALPAWLHRYNWHRPHASLGQLPPISRLGLTRNNLLRHHS